MPMLRHTTLTLALVRYFLTSCASIGRLFHLTLQLFVVAEPYVTKTLALGGLVEVGAHQSRGGVFGTLGVPGTCAHRLGHYPLRAVYLAIIDSGRNFTNDKHLKRGMKPGRGKAFLEYTEEDVAYGPVRDHNSTEGQSELAMFEARYAEIAARTPGSSSRIHFVRGLVPGPFVNGTNKRSGSPYLTSLQYLRDTPPDFPVRDADGNRVRESHNFRLGLSFSELCAPIYYFVRTGILLLRTHEAWSRAAEMSRSYEQGACAPMQKRDKPSKTNSVSSTCSDVRGIPHESAQDSRIASLLYP